MKKYQEYTALLEKYPYFAYAALKAIPSAPDDESRNRLRRIVAVNVGNPVDLAEILGLNSDSLADFYPDVIPPKLSTFDTIDTFLSTFGQEREMEQEMPAATETAALDPDEIGIIPDTSADRGANVSLLPAEARTSDGSGESHLATDSTASAIAAFLKAVPPPAPKRRPTFRQKEPAAEESPALTESFARILIKNRNYEKALEIIQGLNLNNPEKSVYFADQIRFLKKLILNESRKKG